MRFLVGVLLAAAITGCHTHADVLSAHADRYLVDGANTVPWHEGDPVLHEYRGVARLVAGGHAVLLVEDWGSRAGATDSGNYEGLLIELPALQPSKTWRIAPDEAHVWMWCGSCWMKGSVEGAAGTVSTDKAEGREWTIRVDMKGQMVYRFHVCDATPVDQHHGFTLSPMTFEEFDKREAFIWTRR